MFINHTPNIQYHFSERLNCLEALHVCTDLAQRGRQAQFPKFRRPHRSTTYPHLRTQLSATPQPRLDGPKHRIQPFKMAGGHHNPVGTYELTHFYDTQWLT